MNNRIRKHTAYFSDLDSGDVGIAGGKGASLGEMTQAGIPVPQGFVVLSHAFELFLEETELEKKIEEILSHVDHKRFETVEDSSERIQDLVLNADMPEPIVEEIKGSFTDLDAEYVAVRSSATAEDSATAAWAGQLESYLNTTEAELIKNIQKCWASLFTPRAIFYRFDKGLHTQKISVAVVVQKMVESERSGIAFSVHPVTENHNHVIIEAGLGLGEAIVSGSVTPDSYLVTKAPRGIAEVNVNEQTRAMYRAPLGGNMWKDLPRDIGGAQALEESEIHRLADIVLAIEKHYGFPCDVEWAFEKGTFFIVQSRPITTLTGKAPTNPTPPPAGNPLVIDGIERTLGVARNVSFWHQYVSAIGHHRYSKDFGLPVGQTQAFLSVNGTETYIFLDPMNAKAHAGGVISAMDTPEKIASLKGRYELFAQELMESLEACQKNLSSKNWDTFLFRYTRMCAGLMPTAIIGRAGGELLFEKLRVKGYVEDEIPGVVGAITYPERHTPLFRSQLDLLTIGARVKTEGLSLKQQEVELSGWLAEHQHIPVNFCDEPWTLDDAKEQLESVLLRDCEKELQKSEETHNATLKRAKEHLRKMNDEKIASLALAIAEGTYLNEFRKGVFSRVSLGYRNIFSLAATFGGSSNWRDCFFLTPDEMTNLLFGRGFSIAPIVLSRQVVACKPLSDGSNTFLSSEEAKDIKGFIDVLTGKSGSSAPSEGSVKGYSANRGIIRAVARVVLSSKDFHKIGPGEVLVTTMTSVDFVSVMERAGAFVTNEGGITSHASIVAREMNKPCIIGTKIGTQVIKDGDFVEVDADRGIVTVLE